MISLSRLPEPSVLAQNKEQWLSKFLELRSSRPNARPHSSQYAHNEILQTLRAMSFHKCFYCERKLTEQEEEVDHYIEIAERPDLAFIWENLCLSCQECNAKLSNRQIPATDCLHPCDPTIAPELHLTFEHEFIRPHNASQVGGRTIQKYKLDRDDLNHKRVKHLHHFVRQLLSIRDRQIHENRSTLTIEEKELLASFQQPDQPFSLMFRSYLTRLNL